MGAALAYEVSLYFQSKKWPVDLFMIDFAIRENINSIERMDDLDDMHSTIDFVKK